MIALRSAALGSKEVEFGLAHWTRLEKAGSRQSGVEGHRERRPCSRPPTERERESCLRALDEHEVQVRAALAELDERGVIGVGVVGARGLHRRELDHDERRRQ
jgi:hypothetical protein